MGYDWARLQREDDERSDRAGLALGVTYLTMGVLGVVLTLVGVVQGWGAVAWQVLVGAGMLVGYQVVRRRRRDAPPADGDTSP